MIAREETFGLAYYHAVCRYPHYPGYSSGITIGVGYDLRLLVSSLFGICGNRICLLEPLMN